MFGLNKKFNIRSALVALLTLALLVAGASPVISRPIGFLIEEVDGSPAGYTYKLKVSSGSLSLAGGIATLAFETAWGTATVRDADATPEVAHGGFYSFTNTGALTITDFVDSDGDHSDFNEGDKFLAVVADADITIQFNANVKIEGNGGVDFTGSPTQVPYLEFVYHDSRWNCENLWGMSDPTTLALSSITGVPITLDDDVGVITWGGADELADETYNGHIVGGIDAGEAIGQWDTVFIKNDTDPIWEADATVGSGEYPAFGIAVAAAGDTAPVTILTQGVIRNENWAGLTIGGAVYLGEGDGTLTQTAPSTANDCVQIIGWAISASEIYFDFSRPYQLVE